MKKYTSMQDVADKLGDRGPLSSPFEFDNCRQVVDALIELGNTDKVYSFHDDHLSLRSELSSSFMQASVEDGDLEQYEDDVALVLDNAERIFELSDRELTEEQEEDMREDLVSRGLDPDDYDF